MDNIIAIKPLGFPWETRDPFLFCAHHRDEYPAGNSNMGVNAEDMQGRLLGSDFTIKDGFRMYHGTHVPGFPYHPHRGFETITINKEGFVDHSDSLGAAGRFGEGDVQWMTTGKGIQHSEMFPLLNEDRGNPLEIFQVWLNLPKASKMVEPHFKMLWKDEVPMVVAEDANGNRTEVNVIAGSLGEVQAPSPTPDSWAANPANGVTILTLKMEAGAKWILPACSNTAVNRTLYFYRGNTCTIGNQQMDNYHMAAVNSTDAIEIQNGKEDGYFLLLQGKPINEPVAQHGPFVMNTEAEIRETIATYQRTQFGGWPWPEKEQTHGKNKGRFALHADGREELNS